MVRQGGFIIRLFFAKVNREFWQSPEENAVAAFFLSRKMCEGILAEGPMKMAATAQKPKPVFMT